MTGFPLLSKVLARMEQGRSLPVLLSPYLRMSGKLVYFNVNPSFNDGLVVVNLKKVPLTILGKYISRDLAQDYLEQHSRR